MFLFFRDSWTTQSDSIVRQTNKRSSYLSYTTMNNKHIFNENQGTLSLVIILMTCMLDQVVILWGEIRCLSLLGLKGITETITTADSCYLEPSQNETCFSQRISHSNLLLKTFRFTTFCFPCKFKKVGVHCYCFPHSLFSQLPCSILVLWWKAWSL